MRKTKFLITGATGATGGAATTQLLARGHSVCALAHREDDRARQLRQAGAEVVIADLLDFDAVSEALKGVNRAYFVYPIRPGIVQASTYFAQAAKEAGVEGVVNMSQISARRDARSHAAQDHWLAERVFDWSGLNVAHVRPTFFSEWFVYLAPMIRQGAFHVTWGTGRHAPIAAEDQARVILAILENPEQHRGKIYPLFGDVELTAQEMAEKIGGVLGKKLSYQRIPFDTLKQMMIAGASAAPKQHTAAAFYGEAEFTGSDSGESYLMQHLREVMIDHDNGVFSGTNDYVKSIGGAAPMSLEAFIEKHRNAFL